MLHAKYPSMLYTSDVAIPSVSLAADIDSLASTFPGAVPGRDLSVVPESGVRPPSAWKPPQELDVASPLGTAVPFSFIGQHKINNKQSSNHQYASAQDSCMCYI